MTPERDVHRGVQVDGGDCIVCADLVTDEVEHGTARIAVHPTAGHVAPGTRTKLVDELLDLPETQHSHRFEATLPMGDAESLLRLRERCEHVTVRAAGSSTLVEGRCATHESGQG